MPELRTTLLKNPKSPTAIISVSTTRMPAESRRGHPNHPIHTTPRNHQTGDVERSVSAKIDRRSEEEPVYNCLRRFHDTILLVLVVLSLAMLGHSQFSGTASYFAKALPFCAIISFQFRHTRSHFGLRQSGISLLL